MFLKKYRPKTLKEIPQEKIIQEILATIATKKPILLIGKSGSGKSAIIETIAHEQNYEYIELNASDTRNKEAIENIIGQASQQMSLFMKKKMIVLEEIDGLAGMEDRGGVQAMTKILTESKHQIIMTTNKDDEKIKPLKQKSKVIEVPGISYQEITNILKKIAEQEHIKYTENDIKTLARHANGDLRAAIIDFEWYTKEKKLDITQLIERNTEETITKALQLIFKSKQFNMTTTALDTINLDLDESLLWIDENIPLEYKKDHEREKAYNYVAKADLFKGRIRKWQYWRYLVYRKYYMTLGVALAKDQRYPPMTYKRETRRLSIWRAGMSNTKKRNIVEKVAQKTHKSKKDTFKNFYVIKEFLKQSNISEYLKLSDDEYIWLKK